MRDPRPETSRDDRDERNNGRHAATRDGRADPGRLDAVPALETIDLEAVTARGVDPVTDRARLGGAPAEPGEPGPAPRDSDDGASRESRDMGNNGNPAQSAGRVTMQEQNAHPESPEDAAERTTP